MIAQVILPLAALVHHPLAFEAGVKQSDKNQFMAFEKFAFARALKVIVASTFTGRLLKLNYNVKDHKLVVATPGGVLT